MMIRKFLTAMLVVVAVGGLCISCTSPTTSSDETTSDTTAALTDIATETVTEPESETEAVTEPETETETETETDTEPETETETEIETEPAPTTTGSQGLLYTLNSNRRGYTCIGIGSCTEADVVLDTYCGLPVTAIAAEAFANCTDMTSITIPSTVKSIGQGAFRNCSGLTQVDIPEGVTELSLELFSGCTSLTTLTLPQTLVCIRSWALSDTRLMKIHFTGSQAKWDAITVENGNREIMFAEVLFDYQP